MGSRPQRSQHSRNYAGGKDLRKRPQIDYLLRHTSVPRDPSIQSRARGRNLRSDTFLFCPNAKKPFLMLNHGPGAAVQSFVIRAGIKSDAGLPVERHFWRVSTAGCGSGRFSAGRFGAGREGAVLLRSVTVSFPPPTVPLSDSVDQSTDGVCS